MGHQQEETKDGAAWSCVEHLGCCPRGGGSQQRSAPAWAFGICARALPTASLALASDGLSGTVTLLPVRETSNVLFFTLKLILQTFLGKPPLTRPGQCSASCIPACLRILVHIRMPVRVHGRPLSTSQSVRASLCQHLHLCVCVRLCISTRHSYTFRFVII